MCLKLHAKGRKKYSADAIVQYLRWQEEFEFETSEYKICNEFRSMMPRQLIHERPELSDFFVFRKAGLRNLTR